MERTDCQYHWRNDGYDSFDDFLARFRSDRRKKVRRERRRVHEAGIRFRTVAGMEIEPQLLDQVYLMHAATFLERGQSPYLTRRFFEQHGVEAQVRLSYGATEAKIPDIADCVVEITETGRALRAAGLKVIDTILSSYTEVIANPTAASDPDTRKAMDQIMTLLNGVLDARGRVLLKLNVTEQAKDSVLAVLPSMKSPTMSPLAGGGYAVESVVEKATINLVIPELIDAGATDLVEMPIAKIIP